MTKQKFVEKTEEELKNLTAEERAAYEKEKAAYEETVARVSSKEFFEEKAKEAAKTGVNPVIDLHEKVKVKFVKDTLYIPKGTLLEISQQAFETYNLKEEVVKKVR